MKIEFSLSVRADAKLGIESVLLPGAEVRLTAHKKNSVMPANKECHPGCHEKINW